MDQKINSYEKSILQRENYNPNESVDDIDLEEFMDDIEQEGFLANYREKRMQQISDHLRSVEKNVRDEGYGEVETIESESTLMQVASKSKRAVVHFSLEKFEKCQYMDEKLKKLAEKHLTVKFVRINVENCPFLVAKLDIKVLPFVIGYKNGKEVVRIVGFAKLGNDPKGFPIEALSNLLTSTGIIDNSPLDAAESEEVSQFMQDDEDSGLDI